MSDDQGQVASETHTYIPFQSKIHPKLNTQSEIIQEIFRLTIEEVKHQASSIETTEIHLEFEKDAENLEIFQNLMEEYKIPHHLWGKTLVLVSYHYKNWFYRDFGDSLEKRI